MKTPTQADIAGKPLLVVIAGPTASGKTAAAIALARHFKTEILSADSRQCYRELNIGVARPAASELAMVPHHFIASHSIVQPVDAAQFAALGTTILRKIFETCGVAIAAGGTGLYIKALCEGMDDMPAVAPEVRAQVKALYEQAGLTGLQSKLQLLDPLFFNTGAIKNPQRSMRALEMVLQTGKSILSYQLQNHAIPFFNTLYIGLDVPREELYNRINNRVDHMMQRGLYDEVKTLYPHKHLHALQTVGYTELFDVMDGNTTLDFAVEKIKQHTRNYAKRQITWFKKINGMHWIAPHQIQSMVQLIESQLSLSTIKV